MGPMSPGTLYSLLDQETISRLSDEQLWVSLGVYNIVCLCDDDGIADKLVDICSSNKISCELWSVSYSHSKRALQVENIQYISSLSASSEIELLQLEETHDSSLGGIVKIVSTTPFPQVDYCILELRALLAVVRERASNYFPEFSKRCGDMVKALELYLAQIEPDPRRHPHRLDALLSLNAGLSRLASQAFAGVTPIVRTESHFWPHSLLGIGIACAALQNITHFVTSIVIQTRYNEQYFANLACADNRLISSIAQAADIDYLSKERTLVDFVSPLDAAKTVEGGTATQDIIATPITYYSGRDGFRNNLFTTSAPLLSVSGCNSVQWNLGTITHELSHRIIAGKLEELYEDIFVWAYEVSTSSKKSESWHKNRQLLFPFLQRNLELRIDSVRQALVYLLSRTLLVFYAREFDTERFKDLLIEEVSHYYEEAHDGYSEDIEEYLVHMFDFFHFYSSDCNLYLSYVWRSWAVQPTILSKLMAYVRRALLAISVKFYHLPNWPDRSIAELTRIFEQEGVFGALPFRTDVRKILADENETARLRRFLEQANYLICFFHAGLKSDVLKFAASAEPLRQPKKAGRKRFSYQASFKQFYRRKEAFTEKFISNPLLFVRDFSRKADPNSAESTWLLHLLALHCDTDARIPE